MRTTKNEVRIPRVLVRISKDDRNANTEREIITNTGERIRFFIRHAPDSIAEQKDNNELSVRVGCIIGVSDGVSGLKKGDIAILDYTIDIDEQYFVTMDNGDKIVAVPCATTLCKEELIATSADEKYLERNVIVQKPGDVEQLSLLLGIVRGTKFIPNNHYLFCEPQVPVQQSLILFSSPVKQETSVQRKVLFAGKQSGFKAGQFIVAIKDSNFTVNIADRRFEIIPVTDVLAILESGNENAA